MTPRQRAVGRNNWLNVVRKARLLSVAGDGLRFIEVVGRTGKHEEGSEQADGGISQIHTDNLENSGKLGKMLEHCFWIETKIPRNPGLRGINIVYSWL